MPQESAHAPEVAALDYLRNEERHEISWITNRLGWFLTTESFLFTAATVGQAKDYDWWFATASTLVLGSFGVTLAVRAHLAVKAAQAVLTGWLMVEQELCPPKAQQEREWGYWRRLPRKMHLGCKPEDDALHAVAARFHRHLPRFVIAVWIFLYATALTHSTYSMPALRDINLHLTFSQGVFSTIAIAVPLALIGGLWRYCKKDAADLLTEADELHGKLEHRRPKPSAQTPPSDDSTPDGGIALPAPSGVQP
jgi:hypothetical protein